MIDAVAAITGEGAKIARDSMVDAIYNAGETSAPLQWSDVVIGQQYIWEPNKPHARCRVVVDEIRCEPNGDVRVFSTTLEDSDVTKVGFKTWNDMSRFVEACVRATVSDGESR